MSFCTEHNIGPYKSMWLKFLFFFLLLLSPKLLSIKINPWAQVYKFGSGICSQYEKSVYISCICGWSQLGLRRVGKNLVTVCYPLRDKVYIVILHHRCEKVEGGSYQSGHSPHPQSVCVWHKDQKEINIS